MGLRIMFMANAPWCTTGYGVQGKHLTPRLRKLGHEVNYFAFYGLQNGVLNIDGSTIYPMGSHLWGADVLDAHMKPMFTGQGLTVSLDSIGATTVTPGSSTDVIHMNRTDSLFVKDFFFDA